MALRLELSLLAPSWTMLTTTRLVNRFALGDWVLLGEFDVIRAGGWSSVTRGFSVVFVGLHKNGEPPIY